LVVATTNTCTTTRTLVSIFVAGYQNFSCFDAGSGFGRAYVLVLVPGFPPWRWISLHDLRG